MQTNDPNDVVVVSSLVVHCRTAHTPDVEDAIQTLAGTTIAMTKDDKLAVVLETNSTESALLLADRIRSLAGVTSVELVAHFFEEEVGVDRQKAAPETAATGENDRNTER